MTDDQQRPRSSLVVWLIVAALRWPVAYVLSSGPVTVYVLSDTRFSYQSRLVFMFLYTLLACSTTIPKLPRKSSSGITISGDESDPFLPHRGLMRH